MEADDLDNLIADSLGGVQTALKGEQQAAAAPAPAPAEAAARAGEAVRELQQGPAIPSADASAGSEEAMFCNLVKSFQDENFQKAISEALSSGGADATGAPAALGPPLAPADGSSGSSGGAATEDWMQNFMKSFDHAVGTDGNFEKSMESLMTTMLSNDLICEPLQQIADKLGPWLSASAQKDLPAVDRARYEAQLKLYTRVLDIYKKCPDPLPEEPRQEVQRLLSELQSLGQPPAELMAEIQPKEAEEGGETLEDFVKSMGLDSSLGPAEQDLLKKLTEDPEELTKAMKEMAQELPGEACKQQ